MSDHATHKAAGKIERKMERAVNLAGERLRGRLTITDVAAAIATGGPRAVERLIVKDAVEDAYGPVGTIGRDAVIEGGKVAARELRKRSKS